MHRIVFVLYLLISFNPYELVAAIVILILRNNKTHRNENGISGRSRTWTQGYLSLELYYLIQQPLATCGYISLH